MGVSASSLSWRSAVVSTVALALVTTACTADPAEPSAEGSTTGLSAAAPRLDVVDASPEIYCDGDERLVGEIQGAEPGERVVLSSPTPIELAPEQRDAAADDEGTYRLMWSCDPSQAGQPWELVVRGAESGRDVVVAFTGTAIDPETVDDLQVRLFDETFLCDGTSYEVGELSNAAPYETVTFTADGVDELLDGIAGPAGGVVLRWKCAPDEAATWSVMAEGLESGRVGEFTIVGVEPPPEELVSPTIRIDEYPFVCDGATRAFATLSGFLPGETVDFASPQASGLREGRADENGDLPVRWTCGDDGAGTVWELTATGARSQRTITFAIEGLAAPPAPDPTVTLMEDPFVCDGATRVVATIGGFLSGEFVDFTSPEADTLRQGQADDTGALPVRWTCGSDDIGRTWDVTATGTTSDRAVTFRITGTAAEE